ncbi:MAG: DUF1343 domain-containing protein [Candidatus Aminicenantes bacterium]|nr:DUF1343 domain-containing protein [Candidatus Aminicenantes bacterium]
MAQQFENRKQAGWRPASLYLCLSLLLFSSLHLLWPERAPVQPGSAIRLGNERALAQFPAHLGGCRLGLVINHTSVLADGTSLLEAFLKRGIDVRAVFTPEHGFTGQEEGGSSIADGTVRDIPVFSLYGDTKKPAPEHMQNIDAFVYDIQDVGTRFYTYITTLKYVLEAASEAEKTVYVLDRPNPLGGIVVEGPLLKERFRSFIGSIPIPIRYGLTPGELALMMKGEGWVPKGLNLHVLSMDNWKRSYYWDDTGLTWIPTSPNIPHPDTAVAFPGTGLLGGIILNQGLGTAQPFLQIGAPWLDTERLVDSLGDAAAFGIQLKMLAYTPRSLPGKILQPPYENRECKGIRIRITDKKKFLSIRFTLAVIKALKENHPENLSLQADSLNRLVGDNILEKFLRGNIGFDDMMKTIEEEEQSFLALRRKYLLYD